ncbi:hypothetical protein E3T61_08720 [Cryobacterium lactosi]|uniref:Protein kinase domain-containing protein n=1 Tax=Cryobacterium lactosi TaxID=1259202 RepID=A0A4R9BY37_9MICO|nr:hypothetical protein [Cryobacterium lactosi]TFD91766.1 hypothetical protein E3T61_08720 [Cryobacterium lactosi]
MEQMRDPSNERTLAGFRVVRRIGTGSRSTVYLAQAVGAQAAGAQAEGAQAVGGQAGNLTVALKVFRLDADRAALNRQVRAMLTVPPSMLVPLRDVATAPDGRLCLVMDRLAGSPLDRLLAERGRIAAGEVVTIAATITATLQALHDAGFSHPMIGPDCVRFDGAGRPVLLGLGALDDLPAGGAAAARRRDDLVRLAGWLRSLVEHLDPRTAEAATSGSLMAEFEAAATARPVPADLTAVESALFDWAPATAVRGAVPGAAEPERCTPAGLIPGPGTPQTTLTRSARPAAVPDPAGRGPVRRSEGRNGSPVQLVLRQVAVLRDAVRTDVAGRGAVWRRTASSFGALGRARRPVLVGVCLAVTLAAGSLVALSWTGSPAASGEITDLRDPAPAPDESPSSQDGAPAGSEEFAATLVGDDPAAATLALLQLRQRCLAAASVLCLDGVDQAGSAAMAADSYAARQPIGPSGEADGRPGNGNVDELGFTASIQERRGNAALIVLTPAAGTLHTQPASALVIRGEAGWRLRELFDY